MEQPQKNQISNEDMERILSASVLRLRMRSPFFATLALYARFRADESIPTASTDGRDIFYNPEFLIKLPPRQQDAVLLHEVLHAALLHAVRRGTRDPVLWNLAADIVVNGIISKQDYLELMPGAIREKTLEEKPAEEIYELLLKNREKHKDQLKHQCLKPGHKHGQGNSNDDEGLEGVLRRLAEYEAYWRQALRQAEVVQRSQMAGNMPAGWDRIARLINGPQLDWRSHLWRFLVKTPSDFQDFDRRFIGRGLYLDALDGETVKVHVCIDTSGSIDGEQLSSFMGELRGILGAYPHLEAFLYYADAALYGPYPMKSGDEIQKPVGGGGTSFVPFFDKIDKEGSLDANTVCVYLTDGFGAFPAKTPVLPTLWVVTPGGLDAEKFPFGEVVRLLRDK
jgi:predicted metal-dependent peptidase